MVKNNRIGKKTPIGKNLSVRTENSRDEGRGTRTSPINKDASGCYRRGPSLLTAKGEKKNEGVREIREQIL